MNRLPDRDVRVAGLPNLRRQRPGRLAHGLLFSLFLLLLGGCAMLPGGNDAPDPFRTGAGSASGGVFELEIRNDHFNDARIYAHWGGERRRIGMVTGATTSTFEIEWRSQEFRVEVDLLAGSGFTTRALTVWPGDHYELRIPSHL